MKIPKGINEEELLKLIDKILKRVSSKHVFGIYEAADIYQEGFIIALSAIEQYDNALPLENYLTTCIKNGLISLKRLYYIRTLTACKSCKEFDDNCPNCQRRLRTYTSKKNLNNPLDILSINPDKEESLIDRLDVILEVEHNEIQTLIDRHLPIKYREDYLRIKSGLYVTKTVRQEIEAIILNILNVKE